MTPRMILVPGLVCVLLCGGCVERTMKIQTDPPNALVIVNDEEVGLSPVKFSFLWYGDYDIIVRKAGYETLKTHHRFEPPWFQFPPIDFIVETLIPGTIRDVREVPLLTLQSTRQQTDEEIVGRAEQTRDRALFGGGEP